MTERHAAWVDLVSPSHPFLFGALTDALPEIAVTTTVRRKTETVSLADEVGFDFEVRGRDFDNPHLRKVGIPYRTARLAIDTPKADVSLSSRNAMCVLASKARNIPSIHFTDNDITAHVDGLWAEELYNWLEARATYTVVPAAFETAELEKYGADSSSVYTYPGYKEDIYVADFDVDPTFVDRLPFEEYVVVRPEALDAAYVDARSIVPDLLDALVEDGTNVVYLPRGRGDETYAEPFSPERVHVPSDAYDGLQLAAHARCVLTGSGTMAREAACMGKPAVSFFPNTLLSVDQELVDEGRIHHSRDPEAIADHVAGLDADDVSLDRSRSRRVRDEVVSLTSTLVERAAK
ncbi:hypothetical protein C479_09173 [Halovivax asiaticus JCM 14624]|uniref:DUF354 domain-containing protein n=1 Tax=Halovivax asiaticus JCM 14624 TaxID=1227490 RepID=M0BJE2_9EURY|nr:DUF354 domain-containing protein [Halovivax asiaticus]ELZ10970.1 hypothetical protein C479_09173 [Halovivax asiaticus JCM 14624]